MALFKKKSTEDIIEQKKKALAGYTADYENAVGLVTATVNRMTMLDEDIGRTIQEIDEYQSELEETKNGLLAAKQRNESVMKNFKALLNEE